MKHEKPVKDGQAELEKNVNKTHEGKAAMAAEELEQKPTKKSPKGISAQSKKQGMNKKPAVKKHQSANPPAE
jgi:hypothetical protein